MAGQLLCALFLGIRQGEIYGLKWAAIDRSSLEIAVSEQLQPIDVQVKTKSAIRVIPVPKTVLDIIDQLGDRQNEYVFTSDHCPLRPNEVSKQTPRL